jgi:hypothetical protein
VCVFLSGEDAEDIVVFVHRLAVVSALLRVPPVGVGVALGAFDSWRIDVAAILRASLVLWSSACAIDVTHHVGIRDVGLRDSEQCSSREGADGSCGSECSCERPSGHYSS